MFRRAWKKTIAAAYDAPGALIAANLTFFLFLLPPAVLVTGSRRFQWAPWWVALPLAFLWSWMAAAWLVEAMARRQRGDEGWIRWSAVWFKASGRRQLVLALATGGALAWVAMNLSLWPSLLDGKPRALLLLSAATASVGLWIVMAGLLSLGLGSLKLPPGFPRWKLAAAAPVAWFPSCLALLATVLLLSGLAGLLISPDHWSARVFALPLFFAPVATSALAAGLIAGLSDEIHRLIENRAPGKAELPSLRELFRPWDL